MIEDHNSLRYKFVRDLENKIQQLQQENKLLRECVEWYRDNAIVGSSIATADLTGKARKTLAKIKGDA